MRLRGFICEHRHARLQTNEAKPKSRRAYTILIELEYSRDPRPTHHPPHHPESRRITPRAGGGGRRSEGGVRGGVL